MLTSRLQYNRTAFIRLTSPSTCAQVTDLSIQYLTGVCRYLRYLDVSGCILLSYDTHTHTHTYKLLLFDYTVLSQNL